MIAIHPTRISGPWKAGFALDRQIVSSEFVGYNEFGHPMFNTQRTDLGELLYRLKYRADTAVLSEIVDAVVDYIQQSWKPPITLIVPVPASQVRRAQPVQQVAEELGKRMSIPVSLKAVRKTKATPQLKNVHDFSLRGSMLEGAISSNPAVTAGQKILLLDDLYQSGATMCAVAKTILREGKAGEVYALALTRSRT